MADLDLVGDLEAERAKLERLDAELRAQVPAEIAPVVEEVPSWYDSELAREIGITAGRGIGEVLVELFRNLIPSEDQIAAARARAGVVAPPSAPAAVPAIPAQATLASPVEVKGIDLVGHLDEDRRAPTLPTEPLSGHVERLDLETDVRDQVRQRKLSGPVIGASEDPAIGNYPLSGI